MTDKFLISLTHGNDDADRSTLAFVVANAAVASGKDVKVFLNVDGSYLADKGYADDIHEEGFAPLKELMDSFVEAGGVLWVCSPCHKKRGLDENNLVAGAVIVGGAKVVEFLSLGAASMSY